MFKSFRNCIHRVNKDENGEIPVGPILLIALIVIPLVVLLIAFGDQITGYFNEATGELETKSGTLKSSSGGGDTDSGDDLDF